MFQRGVAEALKDVVAVAVRLLVVGECGNDLVVDEPAQHRREAFAQGRAQARFDGGPENVNQPGMVGTIGTILGKDKVNIADMSLSRLSAGSTAYMVVRVDSEPSETARKEIKGHAAIKVAKFVQL